MNESEDSLVDAQLRRLDWGPANGERTNGEILLPFTIHCNGNAENVLSRVREILRVVYRREELIALTMQEWRAQLPAWLVGDPNATPPTPALDPEWHRWIRQFDEWYSWFWWDAAVKDPHSIELIVAVDSIPFSDGTLKWLFRTAGATSVDVGPAHKDVHD